MTAISSNFICSIACQNLCVHLVLEENITLQNKPIAYDSAWQVPSAFCHENIIEAVIGQIQVM